MPLAPGTIVLFDFLVVAPLGSGAMGEVYLTRNLADGTAAAVKVLPRHEGEGGASLAAVLGSATLAKEVESRFRQEVRALSRVNHPRVVRLLASGFLDDGSPAYAMEYVDGQPLDHVLEEAHAFPWPRAVALAQDLFQGLSALHAEGLVHRDIKPANLVLSDDDGRATLIDLGIVQWDAPAGFRLTQPGTSVGTPEYMSPEQAAGEATVRSDLYAAGIVLFEFLVGKTPYAALGERALYKRILEGTPPVVAPHDFPEVPEALVALVARLVQNAPDARPESADEVLAALDALAEDERRLSGEVAIRRSLPVGPVERSGARAETRKTRWLVTLGYAESLTLDGLAAARLLEACAKRGNAILLDRHRAVALLESAAGLEKFLSVLQAGGPGAPQAAEVRLVGPEMFLPPQRAIPAFEAEALQKSRGTSGEHRAAGSR